MHAYGPHPFHTKNKPIADWLRQSGTFVDYTHKVQVLPPSGIMAPLPIAEPASAAEYLYAHIGRDRADTYFVDDQIQMMPRDSYKAVFQRLFDLALITVALETAFDRDAGRSVLLFQRRADRCLSRFQRR